MSIFRQAQLSNARGALRHGRSLTFILLLVGLCHGCKEPLPWVKKGALFAVEKAPTANALVYVYWPREEQGKRNRLWVGPCDGAGQEVLPGSYTAFVVEPGLSCFNVENHSDLLEGNTTFVGMSQHLGSVELNTQPGHTFFLRLGQERFLLISRAVLQPVQPAFAAPEISRCQQLIPLSPDELAQQFLKEAGK
jgi:hypothetical protein